VILLRVYVLWFKYRLSPTAFADSIVASVDQGNYAGAVQMASQKADHPMGAIMKDMLLKADRSDREIERAFEVSAQRELPRMKRLTSFLPQAGNLATLVGLLGTIQGLIEAFGGATAEDAATRQQVLAKGITVAFYNTFFGLAIAVSCALAFIVLNGRQSMIIEATENALMRVRERIYERNRSIRTSRSGS
jgi:biopolymer transport protein ExbB/TolQ